MANSSSPSDRAEPAWAADLAAQVARANSLLERRIELALDWRIALRNGMIAGFGGVLGATIVVSIAFAALRPLQSIERLGPILQRLEAEVREKSSTEPR
jgi:hypothetical protein